MGTHYQGSESKRRVLDTWIKLTRATQTVGKHLRTIMEAGGLTETQFGVLEILYHLGPQRQLVLAHKNLVSSGNITMVINHLKRDGLVTREVDATDRRAVVVTLTPKGKQVIGRVFRDHLEILEQTFQVLSVEEQERLGSLCKKLGTSCTSVKERCP